MVAKKTMKIKLKPKKPTLPSPKNVTPVKPRAKNV